MIKEDPRRFAVAMAKECRHLLASANVKNLELPDPLKPRQLLWMCDRVEEHADDWPERKHHRWIGFIQAAIMANQLVDRPGMKQLFCNTGIAHDESFGDDDMLDHLDPAQSLQLDVGEDRIRITGESLVNPVIISSRR
jgi:hypothetical protein